jgi:Na+/proline symporter
MQLRVFIYYYFPDWIPSHLHVQTIYDGYEKKTGVLAMFLVGHMCFLWLFILFFYNMILFRVNGRVRAFTVDVREVSD